jgi:copper(I)-binding protein
MLQPNGPDAAGARPRASHCGHYIRLLPTECRRRAAARLFFCPLYAARSSVGLTLTFNIRPAARLLLHVGERRQETIMIRIALALTLLGFLVSSAAAGDAQAGSLKISAAWARATPKGAKVGGGYLTITNTGTKPDRLVGGSSDVCKSFELHQMKMENHIMKMRPLANGVEIAPGQTVQLKPGGKHIMLVGLTTPLKQGDHFKATLDFERAGKVDVEFSIAGIGAQGPAGESTSDGMSGTMPMKGTHMH